MCRFFQESLNLVEISDFSFRSTEDISNSTEPNVAKTKLRSKHDLKSSFLLSSSHEWCLGQVRVPLSAHLSVRFRENLQFGAVSRYATDTTICLCGDTRCVEFCRDVCTEGYPIHHLWLEDCRNELFRSCLERIFVFAAFGPVELETSWVERNEKSEISTKFNDS